MEAFQKDKLIIQNNVSATKLLQYELFHCLQDPDVLETPLPKVLTERKKQLTIMRPPDPKRSPVLRVERVIRSCEPSPFNSQRVSPLHHTPSPTHQPTWVGHTGEGSSQQGLHHQDEGIDRTYNGKRPSILLTNQSYGFSSLIRDIPGDAKDRTCHNGITENPSQINNLSPTRHVNETEQSGETSTLLHVRRSGSSRSDSLSNIPGSNQEPGWDPDPTSCKPKRSASMCHGEASREHTKSPLTRGLSWTQRPPPSQDNQNPQDTNIHRSTSLPGIPVIVTTPDPQSKDNATLKLQLKSATNGSFSRAGSLKKKLSKKLSRDYRNTDSEPLVSEENIINKQSQDTFL